jgi:hypothetical protein
MSHPEQTSGSSKQYRNIHINEGARAQLGDIYYIGKLFVDIKEEHHKTNRR